MIGPEPLRLRRDDDVVIAHLAGEIDLANARRIGADIRAAVPNDAAGVVVDLSEATYLDSSGVHLLFDLSERLAGRQQRLCLSLPAGSRVHRVLDLLKVEEVLATATTLEDAIRCVRGAA